MIARIERAKVPLADEARRVTVATERVGQRDFAQPQPLQPTPLQRVDRAGSMRIPSGKNRRPSRVANRRGRVVLGQAHTLAHQLIEGRRAAPGIKAAEVSVTHVVREYEDDVRSRGTLHGRRDARSAPSLSRAGKGGDDAGRGPNPFTTSRRPRLMIRLSPPTQISNAPSSQTRR